MGEHIKDIPTHLHKYIVEQNYDRYTSEDQEVWRFIMHQLKSFLSVNAHPAYVDGLSKTGISTESIPKISEMDAKLKTFGWRAVPVSGFIPPAAFMEFQALGILPIASDMRTVEHILYTPAPDIVHEAAGHAPILVDPDFSRYLQSYAEVASKSLLSSEDLALYEAIRNLSDIKESPHSTEEEIKKCNDKLNEVIASMSYVSEAQLLGRMNWWTAEYGLIGPLDAPKIFGAGLLSSIGESRNALTKPLKLPLTTKCLDYTYDITEQQPQLFVTPDFENLITVLNEMSETLAYKLGGLEALKRAEQANTVCTVVLEGGLCYSGILEKFEFKNGGVTYLGFKGPVQVSNDEQFIELIEAPYYEVQFDVPIAVPSVHGGPKYFKHFPMLDDFVASRVPDKTRSEYDLQKFEAYQALRDLRKKAFDKNWDAQEFEKLYTLAFGVLSKEWLLSLGLLELLLKSAKDSALQIQALTDKLKDQPLISEEEKTCIQLGFELFKKEGLL